MQQAMSNYYLIRQYFATVASNARLVQSHQTSGAIALTQEVILFLQKALYPQCLFGLWWTSPTLILLKHQLFT
jgi:hypothetical protein